MYKCEWLITHPDGRIEMTDSLRDFCKKFGLSQGNMSQVAKGDRQIHKGFKCQKLNQIAIEEILSRNCPECGKIIMYSDKYTCRNAEENNNKCKACANTGKLHSEETKQRLSSLKKGKHFSPETEFKKGFAHGNLNLRFGKSNYETWCENFGKEEADKRMAAFKNKVSEKNRGKKNPMYGKSAPKGSGVGWKGWYRGWFFRSLRELSYALSLDEKKIPWVSAEKSELEINYLDVNGNDRTYRADFLVNSKMLVEIKPGRLHNTLLIQAKKIAAETFCKAKNLNYYLIDQPPLSTDKIKLLHDEKIITFTERYEKYYQGRYA